MKLLKPFDLGPFTLANRMVMAPMTRSRAPETNPQPMMATYYAQRASSGLIITEATQVSPSAQGYPDTPGIFTDEHVRLWRSITDAVHADGGRIFVQLWHVGRISHPDYHDGKAPLSASAIRPNGKAMTPSFEMKPFETPRAIETDEVPSIVQQFRRAASMAKAAGFDGVEIHGANGYLIDQFLQSGTNHRTDRYGGSAENRARFLLEVTQAVVSVWGPDRVGVRLSPGGTFNDMSDDDPVETFMTAARKLSTMPLAYVHVVQADVTETTTAVELIRAAYSGTLIATGDYDRESGEEALRLGKADLIGFGRDYISNPDLPARFALNAELSPWDSSTFYGGDSAGYTDYLRLEEELAAELA